MPSARFLAGLPPHQIWPPWSHRGWGEGEARWQSRRRKRRGGDGGGGSGRAADPNGAALDSPCRGEGMDLGEWREGTPVVWGRSDEGLGVCGPDLFSFTGFDNFIGSVPF
jgi:hypothetical protein